MSGLVGRAIRQVRLMSPAELQAEGWNPPAWEQPVLLVLDDGTKLYVVRCRRERAGRLVRRRAERRVLHDHARSTAAVMTCRLHPRLRDPPRAARFPFPDSVSRPGDHE